MEATDFNMSAARADEDHAPYAVSFSAGILAGVLMTVLMAIARFAGVFPYTFEMFLGRPNDLLARLKGAD